MSMTDGNSYGGWNDRVVQQFRDSGGTVTGFGRSLVLLHHVGAKTGIERVTPVMSIKRGGDTWWITASLAGSDHNPAWFHNLKAHPDVTIETADDGEVPVRVRVLADAERDDAWSRFVRLGGAFGQYQARTSRIIPVLELTRR